MKSPNGRKLEINQHYKFNNSINTGLFLSCVAKGDTLVEVAVAKTVVSTIGIGISSIGIGVSAIGVSSISIGSIVSLGIGISLGISRPLANVVSSGDDSALGHGVKSLGDGVQTGAGAKGDTVVVGSVGVGVSSIGISSGMTAPWV